MFRSDFKDIYIYFRVSSEWSIVHASSRDHFNSRWSRGSRARINCSWTRDGRGWGESRCQRLRSDAAAARSAGNRMEVSTSSVPAATSDHPENVHTHTIDPRGIFHSGFGNFSLEFRRHSPSSGHDAPKNTGQNVWKRKLEWTTALLCTGKTG